MSLLVVCLCVFFGSFLSFPLFRKLYLNNRKEVVFERLDIFSSSCLYSWLLFGILGSSLVFPSLISLNSFIVGLILTLIALYLSYETLPLKVQLVMEYSLCFVGSVLLNWDDSLCMILLTSLYWWGTWRVFRLFDQFPFVSMLMTMVWMMALLIVGSIIELPNFLMILSGMLGLVVFSLFKKRLRYSCINLGHSTASLVGFCCAGIWGYFFLNGHMTTAVCAYSYYLFEICFILFYAFKGKMVLPLFIQTIQRKETGAKAIKIFLWHFLLISLLSVYAVSLNKFSSALLFGLTFFILCYTYMKLTHLFEPDPGYREILGDIKNGVKEIYSQGKIKIKETHLEKKFQSSQKKKSVQKKPVQSKGKKKK